MVRALEQELKKAKEDLGTFERQENRLRTRIDKIERVINGHFQEQIDYVESLDGYELWALRVAIEDKQPEGDLVRLFEQLVNDPTAALRDELDESREVINEHLEIIRELRSMVASLTTSLNQAEAKSNQPWWERFLAGWHNG
jgi:chromosome segregation ATPase